MFDEDEHEWHLNRYHVFMCVKEETLNGYNGFRLLDWYGRIWFCEVSFENKYPFLNFLEEVEF